MPPRIPVRFQWTSGPCLPAVNSTLCIRTFTTTPPSLALGPQSPNYIEVPKPRQPTFKLKPRIKGHLPIPRDVFKTRSPLPKESAEFIGLSTPDPKKRVVPGPYSRDADYQLYKQRLADSRRQALRAGVTELHQRKTRTEGVRTARRRREGDEKRALRMAPPKTVDVLTSTSVQKSIRDFLDDKLPSTSRSSITEARRAAFKKRMDKQAAVRQARLHDLYTNAREFIVDEQQLDEAIEKAFGTEEQPMGFDAEGQLVAGGAGKSVWEKYAPEGVSERLQKLKSGEGVGLAEERLKRVAEELTGGKM
ncbi:hypothetical protein K505DRAFT_322845 [Melanomma pulvis-pyrius CBS 109.77]|uniref:Uncharacterized protein n=1 Tax=Melanomma pulvis-pyrius CBS 109.77 TaxID=1314802 RepID=A0A6A6XLL6_9PLEO|nr:hypothetical protein K505DRAFT_322845 [Melanomma pulvis-pyrius CBS 109.77]